MRGGPRSFLQGFSCLVVLWILLCQLPLRLRGFHPLRPAFPELFRWVCCSFPAVLTPECLHPGLGSFPFARRYLENRFFFLFLRLLRCFSSPGSPPYTMDSCMDTHLFGAWVPPFRYPRLFGYLLLPAAFRSLSRLSSALSAKASALCSFLLNLSPLTV